MLESNILMPFPFEEYLIRTVFEIVNQSSFLRLIVIFLGSILPWIIIAWFIVVIFRIQSFKLKFYYFALAIISIVISRGFITGIIHNFFYFSKPFEVLDVSPIISHTLTSGLLSGYMAILAPIIFIFISIHKKPGTMAALFTVFVGAAQIAAGAYWISAILIGLLVGSLSFFFVRMILPSVSSLNFVLPISTSDKKDLI